MLGPAVSAQSVAPVLNFGIASLATWRLSHLAWAEDGPWDLAKRLRDAAAARKIRTFDCFYCVTLWAAAPVALFIASTFRLLLLEWLALSAAAILLERLTNTTPPVTLRQDETAD